MNEKTPAAAAQANSKPPQDVKLPITRINPADTFNPTELMYKLNDIIDRLNQLQTRAETAEAALMRTIQKFEAHSHNGLGIAVSPVGS